MQFSFQKTLDTLSVLAVGAVAVLDKVAGCSGDIVGTAVVEAAKCTASYLSPAVLGWLTIAYVILTGFNRLTKEGGPLAGMFGKSAVISDTGKVGTVSPAAIVK